MQPSNENLNLSTSRLYLFTTLEENCRVTSQNLSTSFKKDSSFKTQDSSLFVCLFVCLFFFLFCLFVCLFFVSVFFLMNKFALKLQHSFISKVKGALWTCITLNLFHYFFYNTFVQKLTKFNIVRNACAPGANAVL